MKIPSRQERRRRGTTAIEFALVFPMFLAVFFLIIEYSWYFFQRGSVMSALQEGCAEGALYGEDNIITSITAAQAGIVESINRRAGLNCGSDCVITVDYRPGPGRLLCEAEVNYNGITGIFGRPPGSADRFEDLMNETYSGGGRGVGRRGNRGRTGSFIPNYVRATIVSLYQEDM